MSSGDKQVRLIFSASSKSSNGEAVATVRAPGGPSFLLYTDWLRHEPDLRRDWKDAVVVWRGSENDIEYLGDYFPPPGPIRMAG